MNSTNTIKNSPEESSSFIKQLNSFKGLTFVIKFKIVGIIEITNAMNPFKKKCQISIFEK
jgi:hypothetical protein